MLIFGLKFKWSVPDTLSIPSRHRERMFLKLVNHLKEEKRIADAAQNRVKR
jgi:hypothetical protein